MMKFKEDAADLEVKRKFWSAVRVELLRFCQRYAAGHVVGVRETEPQWEVARAAKDRGYPMGLVRKLASLIRRDLGGGEEAEDLISDFQSQIRLQLQHD